MDELEQLTRTLVSIPSHEDPGPAGDRIEAWLREETDASVLRDEVGNVIARRSVGERLDPLEGGAGPSLALVGHHDVVPPDDEQLDGEAYRIHRDGDRLYGRGTADMKGALAAAMLAFRDAPLTEDAPSADGSRDPLELVFASFVGEEVGGTGARHAIETGFVPDYAVVGEGSTGYSAPNVTDVAIAHKGRRASTIVASGESCHASVPEEGSNAIYRACEVVGRLRSIETPTAEVGNDVLEGSLVVTEIDGGTAWNVVPDRCTVVVDERTVPGERAPIGPFVDDGTDVEWIVDQDLPPMRCEDDRFASLVLDACAGNHAETSDPELVAKPHATDAGWLSEAGTTCVVCGPAQPGEAHTATESVSLAVLERCQDVYHDVAAAFPP